MVLAWERECECECSCRCGIAFFSSFSHLIFSCGFSASPLFTSENIKTNYFLCLFYFSYSLNALLCGMVGGRGIVLILVGKYKCKTEFILKFHDWFVFFLPIIIVSMSHASGDCAKRQQRPERHLCGVQTVDWRRQRCTHRIHIYGWIRWPFGFAVVPHSSHRHTNGVHVRGDAHGTRTTSPNENFLNYLFIAHHNIIIINKVEKLLSTESTDSAGGWRGS